MKKFFVLLIVLGLLAGGTCLAQAGTLSWQTEPVLGWGYFYNGNVHIRTSWTQLTDNSGNPAYDENGFTPVYGPVIPHYSMASDPLYQVGQSVSTFYIDPDTWDSTNSVWYDPDSDVYSGSGVYLSANTVYTHTTSWAFKGTNPYTITNKKVDFSTPENFIMLSAHLYDFWNTDVGNWTYTETWTNNSDSTDTIVASRDFTVAAVPEPATMLLLALGLAGLAGVRRKIRS